MMNLVRPGDALIVSCNQPMTAEDAAALRERLMSRLPVLADVVILNYITVEAVYRAEA